MTTTGSHPRHTVQRGAAAVEFALVVVFMLMFIFGTIEVARVIYLWSTMSEVTRQAARGAAMADFTDAATKLDVRRHAMFLTAENQKLILGGDIDEKNLLIDYLKYDAQTPVSTMPTCRAQNLVNCLNSPKSDSCVRFVRVRLCQSTGGGCAPVPYQPMVSFLGISALGVNMPWFTAIVPIETMGTPGACS